MFVYLVTIITVALYLWMSWLAFRRRKRNVAIRRFFWLIFLGGIWIGISALQVLTKVDVPNPPFFNFLTRWDFALAAIIAYLGASFALHFPQQNKAFTLRKEALFALPAMVLFCLSLFSNTIIATTEGTLFYSYVAWGYWPYITAITLYFIGFGLGGFLHRIRVSSGIVRLQASYLAVGYGITITTLLIDSILNATVDFNDKTDLWLSNAGLIFLGACGYSVLKHRLFGLRFLVRRGAVIAFTLFLLFFLYTYFILSLQHFIPSLKLSEPSATAVVVMLIVLSYPLLGKIARRFSRTLFAESTAIQRERVQKKIRSFTEKTNFQTLFSELTKELQSKLNIKNLQGFVLDQKEGYLPFYPNKANPRVHFNRAHPVIHLLRNREHLLVREEIPYLLQDTESGEREQLLEAEKLLYGLDTEIVVLLGSDDNAPALLTLSEKQDGSVYTTEEISLIKEICNLYSTDFQNFFMYQQALRRVGVNV